MYEYILLGGETLKNVVIYESKYGTTKQYAKWIAQELSCDLFEKKNITPNSLATYTTIIYGGGLYAGGVSGINLITNNFEMLKNKNLVLFTCGLADPTDPENVDSIRKSLKKTLTPEMDKKIKVFHLRGGIDYSKLGFVHKSMMAMLHKMMLKKSYDSLRNEDKEMLATYGKKVNFTNKGSINSIINYIQKL